MSSLRIHSCPGKFAAPRLRLAVPPVRSSVPVGSSPARDPKTTIWRIGTSILNEFRPTLLPSHPRCGATCFPGGRRTCLSAGRQRTKGGSALTRYGSSFRLSLRSSEHGKSVCVLRLVAQAENAVTLGGGWRLYSARISVLYSLGFVVAGAPVSGQGSTCFRWGRITCT